MRLSPRRLVSRFVSRVLIPILPGRFSLAGRFWQATVIDGYEPEVKHLDMLLSHCPGVAVDVGANQGLWTLALHRSGLFRDIHSFEPAEELLGNLEGAQLGNVHIHKFALSDVCGTSTLRTPVSAGLALNGWASLEQAFDCSNDAVHERQIRVETLDSLNLSALDFMKVDVEGHELSMLHGGRETLKRFRPTCIVEVRARNLPTVEEYFLSLNAGYRLCDSMRECGVALSGENIMF